MKRIRVILGIGFLGLSLNQLVYSSPPAPGAGVESGEKSSVATGPSIVKPGQALPPFGVTATTGANKVIVIRVDFSDTAMAIGTQGYFQGVCSNVADYYDTASNSQLILSFQVTATCYTLGNTVGYYSSNRAQLVTDAINAADTDVDFSQFDSVIVAHAGNGKETSGAANDIWSCRTSFTPINIDGVDINAGIIVPESQFGGQSIIGVTAHEYGHELGLPDLYNTLGEACEGIGDWGLMASGNWNGPFPAGSAPAGPCAWSKIYLGWVAPTVLNSEQAGYSLTQVEDGGPIVKIYCHSTDQKEYFLLENRQNAGVDSALPGYGLLVWHVDENVANDPSPTDPTKTKWEYNELQTPCNHKFLHLEQADAANHLDAGNNRGDATDPYCSGNNTGFTDATNPDARDYATVNTSVSITGISASGNPMTFDFGIGFRVSSATRISATQADVVFDTNVNPATGTDTNNYSLSYNPTINPTAANFVADSRTIRLTFGITLSDSTIYTLTISNVTSAQGAPLVPDPVILENAFGTTVSGIISSNTIWSSSGNPYYITDDIIIEHGAKLTIDNGVMMKLKKINVAGDLPTPQCDIIVHGNLLVSGTPGNPVIITSAETTPNTGDWGKMRFESDADDSGTIDYAQISYGKEIECSSASPTISHNTVSNMQAEAVVLWGNSAPLISTNTVTTAGDAPAICCGDSSNPRIVYNSLNGNPGATTYPLIQSTDSSSPQITSNTISNNANHAGISVNSTTSLPTIRNNNITNNSWGIYSFNNAVVDAKHNYWSGNTTADVGGAPLPDSSLPLSNPVDRLLSATSMDFKDSAYSADVTSAVVGDTLYIQITGADNDGSTVNQTLARVISDSDQTGIWVHLSETGTSSGIYRGTAVIDSKASNDTSDSIASCAGQTIASTSVHDSQRSDTVGVVGSCPTANAGANDTVCSGTCTVLNGSAAGGVSPYTYSWSPDDGSLIDTGGSHPTACPDTTTTYTLTVTDSNGCTDADTVLITVNPSPTADAGAGDTICSGSCTTLNGSVTGGSLPYTYSWSPDDGSLIDTGGSHPTACPDTTTTYTLTVTDSNGCTDADTVLITVNPSPTADADSDVSICSGTCTIIGGSPTVSGGASPYTYLWTPNTGLSSDTAANPSACPATTITYTLTVTDNNGCTATDQVTVTVSPAIIYVNDSSGSDANDGLSPATAKKTISAGVAAVCESGTVSVAYGTYNENVNCTKTVNLVGVFGADSTTIDGVSGPVVVFDGGGVGGNISGFTITGGTDTTEFTITEGTGGNGCGVWCKNGADPTITNNTIDGNSNDGICCDTSSPIITKNTIIGNSSNGIHCYQSSPIITNNIITANMANWGINCWFSSPTITNNTIIKNNNTGIGCWLSSSPTITNNIIISNHSTGIIADGSSSPIINFNDVWNNATTDYDGNCTAGPDDISANPEFVNAAGDDYHLKCNSTCIDAGANTAPGIPATDKDGNHRPWGGGIADMGAYEYQGMSSIFPKANFTANNQTPCSGTAVQFTANCTGTVDTYSWDFGDGQTSSDSNPAHTYQTTDPATVTLTVTGPCGTDTETKMAYIDPVGLPEANFTADNQIPCSGASVQFTAQCTGSITSYAWDFGDGDTSTAQDPSHLYNSPGTYTVSLVVSDTCGSDSETKTGYITVNGSTVSADFSATTTVGCASLTVDFADSSTGDVLSYLWDFGDGDTSTAQGPSHLYSNPGTYTVSLVISDICGSDTETKAGYIVVGDTPIADFTADNQTPCSGTSIQFTSICTGTVDTYAWDFGDGQTSSDSNPAHTYQTTDPCTVTLTVTGPCGTDTETKVAYIIADTCCTSTVTADFASTVTTGCAPLTVDFADSSTGDVLSYLWEFGDGDTSTLKNPGHTYNNPGTYTVTLTASDTCGSDTATATIEVLSCAADLAVYKWNQWATSPGEELNYYLWAVNWSTEYPARGVVLFDTLPEGVSYLSCSIPGASENNRVVTIPLGTMGTYGCGDTGNWQMSVVTVRVNDISLFPQELINEARITSGSPDENESNNYSQSSVTVQAPWTNLSIYKWPVSMEADRIFHPGSEITYHLVYCNQGPAQAAGVIVTDTLPSEVSYISSTPAGNYDTTTHTISWNAGTVTGLSFGEITLLVEISPSAVPGQDVLTNLAQISCQGQETVSTDNVYSLSVPVGGSYDPNEKIVSPDNYIKDAQELNYIIHYENEGIDPTFMVNVTDTLSLDLDETTLKVYDGGVYNPATRAITWMDTIPLAPGATRSVSFRISLKSGLISGTEIRNSASIKFDYNDPMVTNGTINIIDTTPPNSSISSLAEKIDETSYAISWNGSDAHSGLRYYTIYLSGDGSLYALWKEDTTDTRATFTGEPGQTYYFYSVAEDNVGNVESAPAGYDLKLIIGEEVGPTEIKVFPNPYKAGDEKFGGDKIFFSGLAQGAKVEIYTITGELVYSTSASSNGVAEWRLKNKKDKEVGSGIYIYLITPSKKVGKIAIIR